MEEVPQIVPQTGISEDYKNEYTPVLGFISMGVEPERLVDILMRFPIKRYTERFPLDKYYVINDKNKGSVRRLDELADVINREFMDPETFDEAAFKRHYNEVHGLIYNEKEPYFPEVLEANPE